MGDVNVPVQFGWQQIVLILIAIIAIGLIMSTVLGLIVRVKEIELLEDEYGRPYRRLRHRRHFRWKRGASGILVLVLAVSLLWVTFAVQTYLGITGDIKVATVRASTISNQSHKMFIDLTLYDDHGNVMSHNNYEVDGDRWELQGNIMKFKPWMNILGLHSGYKVTRLAGQYNDFDAHVIKPIPLNGGDGDFFNAAQKSQAWTAPFVDATYFNIVGRPADGKSYDVYVSQTGYHL